MLTSLDPTGRMMQKVNLSEKGMEDYTKIYAEHHLRNVEIGSKDVSRGDVVADHNEWKPVQLIMAILHDFALTKSRQQ